MILEKPPKDTPFTDTGFPIQQRWQSKTWQAVNWLENVPVPAHSNSNGVAGQFSTDGTYFYVCIATNSWKRVALSSF